MPMPMVTHVYNIYVECLDCGWKTMITLVVMSGNVSSAQYISCEHCGASIVVDISPPAITTSIREHGPMYGSERRTDELTFIEDRADRFME